MNQVRNQNEAGSKQMKLHAVGIYRTMQYYILENRIFKTLLLIGGYSILGLSHRVAVDDVIGISEVHSASISDPEDGHREYFRNFGNIDHIHKV